MKVLLIGSYGRLGVYLSRYLERQNIEVVKHGRSKDAQFYSDLKSIDDVKKMLSLVNPDVIVNLAAITDVAYCEENEPEAQWVNAKLVEAIVLNKSASTFLVHLSSDHVYVGNGPHYESEKHVACNVYAKTKLAGEAYVDLEGSCVLRINYLAKSELEGRLSLSDWVYCSVKNSRSVYLYNDVMFNPLFVDDICYCIHKIMILRVNGLFNLGAKGSMSKAEFGQLFIANLGLDVSFVETGPYNSLLSRPLDMSMSVSKIESVLDLRMPDCQSQIISLCGQYD